MACFLAPLKPLIPQADSISPVPYVSVTKWLLALVYDILAASHLAVWFGFFVLFWLERNLPRTPAWSKKTWNQHLTSAQRTREDFLTHQVRVQAAACHHTSGCCTVRGNGHPSFVAQPHHICQLACKEETLGKATWDETQPHLGAVWQETGLQDFSST